MREKFCHLSMNGAVPRLCLQSACMAWNGNGWCDALNPPNYVEELDAISSHLEQLDTMLDECTGTLMTGAKYIRTTD